MSDSEHERDVREIAEDDRKARMAERVKAWVEDPTQWVGYAERAAAARAVTDGVKTTPPPFKWFKGITLRVLKRYQRKIRCFDGKLYTYISYHEGGCYSIPLWEKLLTDTSKLKPGDKVWNCYTSTMEAVKEVVFYWGAVCRRGREHPRAMMIDDFHVETESGYHLADETMFDPNYYGDISDASKKGE